MKMDSINARLALSLMLMCAGQAGRAQEVHFGGFGTLGISCFSSDTADYVLNDQPKGPGRSQTCDTGLDSRVGVQVDLGLSDKLDFAVQAVADRNADRTFTPDIAVAQLRWQASEQTTIRLGRMPTPSFLHSEDRLVSYSQPWVRPPLEVYGLMPIYSNDGLEIIYEDRLGDWHVEWHGGLTRVSFDSPKSNANYVYPIDARQAYLSLSLQSGNTVAKLGYNRGKVSIHQPDLETLLGTLRFLGANGLADDLAVHDSLSQQISLGVRHEQDDWLFMGEIAYRSMDGFFRDQIGAYATVGRRLGNWMPYATLAHRWTRGPNSDSRAATLPAPLPAAVTALLASSRFDTTSLSLGLSRDLGKQATFKFQADYIRPDRNSWGLYTNAAPAYDYANPGGDWLLTVALDFIF